MKKARPRGYSGIFGKGTGWLSPKGIFYPCKSMGHIALSQKLGFDDFDIDKQCWIKMNGGKVVIAVRLASQKQLRVLADWYMENGWETPENWE